MTAQVTPAGIIVPSSVEGGHVLRPTRSNIASFHGVGELCAAFEYDFADLGGAVGNIALNGPNFPSTNAMITRVVIEAITAPTSGGSATIAIVLGGASVQSATAFDNALYNTLGLKRVTVSAPHAVTDIDDNRIVIATAALTAGRFFIQAFWQPTVAA